MSEIKLILDLQYNLKEETLDKVVVSIELDGNSIQPDTVDSTHPLPINSEEIGSGEIYLDMSRSKLIIDGSLAGQALWIEITPYCYNKVIITYNNDDKCKYPFSVSSSDDKKGNEVEFLLKPKGDKYHFGIGKDYLDAVISKGNQISDVDTSIGNRRKPQLYFKGTAGLSFKKAYIDGNFIKIQKTVHTPAFGFYLEESAAAK